MDHLFSSLLIHAWSHLPESAYHICAAIPILLFFLEGEGDSQPLLPFMGLSLITLLDKPRDDCFLSSFSLPFLLRCDDGDERPKTEIVTQSSSNRHSIISSSNIAPLTISYRNSPYFATEIHNFRLNLTLIH